MSWMPLLIMNGILLAITLLLALATRFFPGVDEDTLELLTGAG